MSQTLDHCQSYPDSSALPGIAGYDFPQPEAAPAGTTLLTTYPSDRTEDPGYLLYSWPANLTLDYKEQAVLELFLTTFATGQTSDLYNLFINSKTRQVDIGASEANGWVEDDFGIPICFSVTGVTSSLVNQKLLDSVGALIIGAVRKVHDFADGSPELKEFNNRTRSRLIEQKKNLENHLNQPPMFGFRTGPSGAWLSKMEDLERVSGFRKSLVYTELVGRLDSLLALNNNIWRERIDTWRLLTVPPYAVAATPSPDIVKANTAAKESRLASYVEGFEKQYGVSGSQEAIARYKAEFDAKTAELEAVNAKLVMPGFIDNPPMTADDQLDFKTITVAGKVPMVASTFENMTAARLGLAFRLDVIPESLTVYVPFLPSVLTAIGVVKDGEIIPFDKMQERLRQEVLGFNAYFSTGFGTGRVELVLAGHGGNREELFKALGWMDASLYSPYLSKDNLPRILDRLDQMIQSGRNRMKGSEESWVNSPANGYRFDNNPLMMSTNCFLTQIHSLQRLRWLLTDPGDETSRSQLAGFLQALQTAGTGKDREALSNLLAAIESADSTSKASLTGELLAQYQKLGVQAAGIAKSVVQSLRLSLGDVPDASLASDWQYLCSTAKDDLLTNPEKTLTGLNDAIGLLRRADNARAFMTSNTADREAALPRIETIINKLGKPASIRQHYADSRRVVNRLARRMPGLGKPIYVGLLYEGTQNGVLIMNALVAGEWDTTTNAVLDCLSGKMYGGGGPHGLFMKTWAAGLAYSNGYGIGQQTGRASYYAERCPDISETMKFVVNELKTAQPTPDLTDYAIAQVFGSSRSPDRYESRGEAMAADLADGYTPEVVRRYSEKVLQLRKQPNLLDELKNRMENVYGTVLIGYGRPLSESTDGQFFIIGPEKQFQSLEQYIASTESPQTVYRLYPRDFWLTL
jgi:Zn-dependent M16 (insulinase) family peptidase